VALIKVKIILESALNREEILNRLNSVDNQSNFMSDDEHIFTFALSKNEFYFKLKPFKSLHKNTLVTGIFGKIEQSSVRSKIHLRIEFSNMLALPFAFMFLESIINYKHLITNLLISIVVVSMIPITVFIIKKNFKNNFLKEYL
jgi:hypothetical protein